jgi:hypothetical protein
LVTLLETFHVDWEAALVGRLVEAERGSWTNRQLHQTLGQYGSNHAAALLNQFVEWLPPPRRGEYVDLLAAFIDTAESARKPRGEALVIGYSTNDIERVAKAGISPAIQLRSLHLIEQMVSSDCSHDVAFAAIRVFARTLSPSSISALEILEQRSDSWEKTEAARVLTQLNRR